MAQTLPFGEVLDAADRLTVDEQETLVAILRRRLAEQGRALRDRLEQIRIRWGARP